MTKALYDPKNLKSRITSLAVDADEQYIAAGMYDGSVWINRLNSNEAPFNQHVHKSSVNDLKFGRISGDKLQLATAGADGMINLIDVKSALQNKNEDIIPLTGHTKWVYAVGYTSDGKWLFSSGEDNLVIAWKPSMSELYKALNNNKP